MLRDIDVANNNVTSSCRQEEVAKFSGVRRRESSDKPLEKEELYEDETIDGRMVDEDEELFDGMDKRDSITDSEIMADTLQFNTRIRSR